MTTKVTAETWANLVSKFAHLQFRQKFECGVKKAEKWYPGHMARGMFQMQKTLAHVDCIIEVHDARIPLSGRNPTFHKSLAALKPHILLLSKSDLISKKQRAKVQKHFICNDFPVENLFFVNSKDQKDRGINKVMPRITHLITNSERYHRSLETEWSVMVIGIPNVGKSTFINILRSKYTKRGGGARVGAMPGITRGVSKLLIQDRPLMYLYDTPGVTAPSISNIETALKLAVCQTLKDHTFEPQLLGDYLLFHLNRTRNFAYVELFGLEEPTDDTRKILIQGAIAMGSIKNVRSNIVTGGLNARLPDLDAAATNLVRLFQKGVLGNVLLDDDLISGS